MSLTQGVELLSQNQTQNHLSSKWQEASELIEHGEYHAARAALGDLWLGLGERPKLIGYSVAEQAQILLIIGLLTSRLGHERQVESSQEMAKNLISESVSLFTELQDTENWAIAQCRLATCYWQTGEFSEARIIYQTTLEREHLLASLTRWKLLMNLINVEISSHNYRYAEFLLKKVEQLNPSLNNDLLLGNYFFHLALVQKLIAEEENNQDFTGFALANYQVAFQLYSTLNKRSHCASVANNIATLMLQLGKNAESHKYSDHALAYYLETKEMGYAAGVYDTIAQVYRSEGKLREAEKAAIASVSILREGDEYSQLAHSLITLGVIFAQSGALLKAHRAFDNALTVARRISNNDIAGNALLTCLEELGSQMPRTELVAQYYQADELLVNSNRITVVRRLKAIAQRIAKQYQDDVADIVINLSESSPEQNQAIGNSKGFHSTSGQIQVLDKWHGFNLKSAVHEFEARHISRALNETGGNLSKAARLLGLSHQNLSLQLKLRHQGLAINKKPRKKRTVTPK